MLVVIGLGIFMIWVEVVNYGCHRVQLGCECWLSQSSVKLVNSSCQWVSHIQDLIETVNPG